MTKAEFIESRQAEALIVDEDMRRAASIIHERLWGSPLELASRHNPDEWAKCDHTYWYFDQLAMKYAYQIIGARKFSHRPTMEALVNYSIILSAIGEAAVYPFVAGEFADFTYQIIKPSLPHGTVRLQRNLMSVRQWFYIYGRLPRSIEDLRSGRRSILFELKMICNYARSEDRWTMEERDRFATRIVKEITTIASEWGLPQPRTENFGEWLYADLDNAES